MNKENIFSIIENGLKEEIQSLVDQGLLLDKPELQWEVLCHAIKNQRLDTVKYLLSILNFDQMELNSEELSPLGIASELCNLELLRILLDSPVRSTINKYDCFGLTPLLTCLQNNEKVNMADCLKFLVENGADVNLPYPEIHLTPVMNAANLFLLDIVDFMLDNGAEVNMQDSNNDSLLHILCQNAPSEQLTKCVEKIMPSLTNINLMNCYKETPSYLSVLNQDKAILKLLTQSGCSVNDRVLCDDIPLLSIAIMNSKSKMVSLLLEMGCDVNANDASGLTPLMYAACVRSMEAVQLLLDKGADVNTSDQFGFYACKHCYDLASYDSSAIKVLKLLIENGADKNFTNEFEAGRVLLEAIKVMDKEAVLYLTTEVMERHNLCNKSRNLFHYLANRCNFKEFEELCEGLDISQRDIEGNSPIVLASFYQNLDFVKYLVDHNCNVNNTNNHKQTALIKSISSSYTTKEKTKVIETLCQAGADVNIQDIYGLTAMHHLDPSKRLDYIKFVQLFLSYGGHKSLDLVDVYGKTLVNYALHSSNVGAAWYFITQNAFLGFVSYGIVRRLNDLFNNEIETILVLYQSGAIIDDVWQSLSAELQEELALEYNKLSLKSRCRRCIRQVIGSGIEKKVTELPVSEKCKTFLLMTDLLREELFDLDSSLCFIL